MASGIGIALLLHTEADQAEAATFIWSGGHPAQDKWTRGQNWVGSVPDNNGTADVQFDGSTKLTPNMDANWNILSLTFNSGAGAFTLGSTGGSTLTIQAGGITNNSASTETINNAITLGAAQTWSATSGALTFGGNLLTVNGGFNTSATAIISGTGGLTKNGAGTLTLSGVNIYTGATTVSAGTLAYGASNVISTGAVTVNGATAILNLGANQTDSVGTVTLAGGGSITGTGTSALTSSGTFEMQSGSASAILAGSGIVLNKTTTGTITLTGANTYTGATNVSAGILNIQNATGLGMTAAGTTVSSGATLQLQGGITGGAETLNITGTGASGQTGALVNVSSTNNFVGLLTLAGATTISSDSGTLNLTNVGTITGATFGLTLDGAGSGSVSSIIGTTTGTLTKNGAGTWTLSGANTYAGLTTVSAGTLAYGASNVIGTGALTVNGATAILNLGANQTDSVGTVTVAGGGSITGTGTSALTSTGTFEMQSGSVSVILAGTGIPLNKTTSGTVTLTGANTYTGLTTVSAGVLNIQITTALGTTAAGTTVSAGAALQIQGNLAVGAEALTLNGTGIASDGALRNVSGNNTWSGATTLGSASTIASDSGTLTHSGSVTNGGHLTTYSGAGNVTATGVISGTGGVTKTGAGTLTMSGAAANTFTGNTTVSGGTLAANADGALGGTGKVTINTGGTVLLGTTGGNDRIGNTAEVALAGGTFNTGGFTETVGKMTLSANSTLNFGSGTSHLTFDGTSTLGTSTLTILNWSGVQGFAGGTDRLLFDNSSFVGGTNTNQIAFNIGGTLYSLYGADFKTIDGNTVEAVAGLVPVPAPSTILGAGTLVIAIAWRERKRVSLLLRRKPVGAGSRTSSQ